MKPPSSKPIPNSYICPITQVIMLDPVLVTSSGKTYERDAIEQWLTLNGTDPQTRLPASVRELVVNYTLRDAIQEWLHENPQYDVKTFFMACRMGYCNVVQDQLSLGAPPNLKDEKGLTPLLMAIKVDQLGIVKILVENGADIQLASKPNASPVAEDEKVQLEPLYAGDDYTPLFCALEYGWLRIAQFLLDKGAKLTPAMLVDALVKGRRGIVDFILDQGFITPDLAKLVNLAIEKEQGEIAKRLIAKDPTIKPGVDYYPLFKAIEYKQVDLVKQLIELGVNLEVQSRYSGNTPLLFAVERAIISLKDQASSPSELLLADNKFVQVITLLIAAGARVNAINNAGKSSFQLVHEHQAQALVALMAKEYNQAKISKKQQAASELNTLKGTVRAQAQRIEQLETQLRDILAHLKLDEKPASPASKIGLFQ